MDRVAAWQSLSCYTVKHNQRLLKHKQRLLKHKQRLLKDKQRLFKHEQRLIKHEQLAPQANYRNTVYKHKYVVLERLNKNSKSLSIYFDTYINTWHD